ncbi:MAG: sigma-70 family RNA polymerase sigma factor [Polyangia bacterium]
MTPAPDSEKAEEPRSEHLRAARNRVHTAHASYELLARQHQLMRRVVSRFVEASCDQEDIIQDALLAAWIHLPAFEGRANLSSWMYRVTTNAALMHLRYHRRRKRDESLGDIVEWERSHSEPHRGLGSSWIQRPDEAMERSELRALLLRKMADLTPRLRTVFVLRYVDGLSIKAASRELRLTECTIKTRLHRACRALSAAIHHDAADVAIARKGKARAHSRCAQRMRQA